MLPENTTAENKSAHYVANFFKEHKIGQALRQSNFSKQKGFPCQDLLQFLVLLVFTGKNLWRSDAGSTPFQKEEEAGPGQDPRLRSGRHQPTVKR
jgi:hypothetical protein